MTKVKALREEGEKLHKEGKHTELMKALAEARKLLGDRAPVVDVTATVSSRQSRLGVKLEIATLRSR